MNEFEISLNKQTSDKKDEEIIIKIDNNKKEELYYKFIVGTNGVWKTLKDFSIEDEAVWIPEGEGRYTIMVQAKEKDSNKPFDYLEKIEYAIGDVKQKLIENIYLNKSKFEVGEKLTITVDSNELPVMYRYLVKEKDKWELIKDYTPENTVIWTVRTSGTQEILVECKKVDSKNNMDDFQKVKYEVFPIKKVEVTDFKCLNTELLAGEELNFEVNADYEDKRMVLYKFVKIDSKGLVKCVQDYSTKRMVSYVEKNSGDFKLLCMVKDMYSPKEYDDRAIIVYKIKPYKKVNIKTFTTDLSSPQVCNRSIKFKAIAEGGVNLRYRYIIEGKLAEDSEYISEDTYTWKPTKAGDYKITLLVKDVSCDKEYEDKEVIEFNIDDLNRAPIKIKDVILDKPTKIIKNETINIKVIAEGGIDLRYSFVVKKNNSVVEKIEYSTCNWVNFTPTEGGTYELCARVKDKYSTKEYDSHSIVYIKAYNYMPANIDYILMPPKENYMLGDKIIFNIITQNTKDTLIKYVIKIQGHLVEETEYIKEKRFEIVPKCSGRYDVEIFAKNVSSDKEYDSKKSMKIRVNETLPITNTKLKSDKACIKVNETVTFTAESSGGKEVLYEFYLMEKGQWNLVQKYSKKNYYGFIPFIKSRYKLLVLAKSSYKKCAYEDYYIYEFDVL